MKLEPR